MPTSSLLASGNNISSSGSSARGSGLFFANALTELDPFRYEALRQPTVDVAVSTEAMKILGTVEDVHKTATTYFATVHLRLPIIFPTSFLDRLPSLFARPQADFTALCLCMHLAQQSPSRDEGSMQSTLYVQTKSVLSLLEATGCLSVSFIQCRILLTYYELGHGIYPAAYISIGACARAARGLGLNKKRFQSVGFDGAASPKAEEEKRVWWAVVNLDR